MHSYDELSDILVLKQKEKKILLCDVSSSTSKPLRDMKFVLGKLKGSKSEVTKAITDLGGVVVSKVDAKTAAVISSKGM